MKKLLLASGALLMSVFCFSSIEPFGYQQNNAELNALPVKIVAALDGAQLLAAAERDDKMGKISKYGKFEWSETNAMECGVWTNLPNGDRLWQLRFRSPNAMGVGVAFNNFYLPEGATLHLYNVERTQFEGPYTWDENDAHGYFRTAEVFGEEAILEYYEPSGVLSEPRLGIKGFGHFYRFIESPEEMRGGSGSCQVDVNCPEGDEWANEKRSVVRLSMLGADGSSGFCSGSLVNNLAYDCKNYILTAYHCTIDADDESLLLSTARFNFQRSNCGSGSAIATQQRTGFFDVANSNDGGGATGSDFAILEMDAPIPANYNVFYAGWNANTTTPQSGDGGWRVRCIHHPSGDVKKISTSNTVSSANWGGAGSHWRVVWMETPTNHGVTEGGSSGSPIYDVNRLIVGTLTGGGSFCDDALAPDFYGKMDKHWTSNPNAANQDAQDWLDPNDSNALICYGANPGSSALPCQPALSTEELALAFTEVAVYPSPAADVLHIECAKFAGIAEVRIYGTNGAFIKNIALTDFITRFDVSDLASGLYYISLTHEKGDVVTQKFTVSK